MSDIFSQPDDNGPAKASEATLPMSDRLGAQAADTLDPQDSLSAGWLYRRAKEGIAGGFAPHDWDGQVGADAQMQLDSIDQSAKAQIPDVSQDDAKAMLKQEGLTEADVHLGDQPTHKLPVLKLQIDEAHTRRDRAAAIERGPQGFFPDALSTVTSIGVGMIDPVNAAAFSIPVLGEARMGKILASAGDSILARGAVKFGQGAAQGAVGTAVLQPADWWLHTHDGKDYTMAQALESVVLGAGMGGAFHAAGGFYGDIRNRMRGLPLEGSPQDLLLRGLMTGTHVHADQLAEEGVPLEDVPGIVPRQEPRPDAAADLPVHPADVLADLPPSVRQDAVHAAMADVIADRPTQAAEMLGIAADHDPRIAESFEAWHGSPHDFDKFDISKLGSGEGAQAYGHGLYFAENEKVARGYQRATSEKAFIDKVKDLYDEDYSPDDAWAEIKDNWKDFTPQEQRLMTALHQDDWLGHDYPHQAVSEALRNIKSYEVSPETAAAAKVMGHMYRVKISADHDHFLDWDKPLSEQSEHVRSALENHPDPTISGTAAKWGHDIPALYNRLSQRLMEHVDEKGETWGAQGPSVASKALSDAGIHGIKYLDQGSRAGGDGTRNFVVFNDKHIEISHKNGELVKREDLIAKHQMQRAKAKGLRGRAAADPRTWSLYEHLASKGGLKPDPELRAIFGNERGPFVPGFGPLIRKSGATLDEALTRAKEGGYLIDPNDLQHVAHTDLTAAQMGQQATLTPRDLLDRIDNENRGQKQYRADHIEATKYDPEQEKHVIMGALEHELEAHGAAVTDIDPRLLDRAVEIVHREGVSDVMEAYERAIMEDEERYNATAEAVRTDPETRNIAGWDAAPDAGAASGDRGRHPEDGRQAGRSDDRARGTDGQESPRAGQTGRSSHAVVAADPRWRELSQAKPDYDDPDVIAESEAAERVPEPESINPTRSLGALEQAARDAEEVWQKLAPTLTPEERTMVESVLNQLNLDKQARDRIITDGAACLLGAIG